MTDIERIEELELYLDIICRQIEYLYKALARQEKKRDELMAAIKEAIDGKL